MVFGEEHIILGHEELRDQRLVLRQQLSQRGERVRTDVEGGVLDVREQQIERGRVDHFLHQRLVTKGASKHLQGEWGGVEGW